MEGDLSDVISRLCLDLGGLERQDDRRKRNVLRRDWKSQSAGATHRMGDNGGRGLKSGRGAGALGEVERKAKRNATALRSVAACG
jgi:hypothetical protein